MNENVTAVNIIRSLINKKEFDQNDAITAVRSLISKQERSSDQAYKWLQDSVMALYVLVNSHDYDVIVEDNAGILESVRDSYKAFESSEVNLNKLEHVLNELTAADDGHQENVKGIS